MSGSGDGVRRWDADDLARVKPTTTTHDVEPQVREPLGSGGTGGLNQYSPIGEMNQYVDFYRRLVERHSILGGFVVGVVLGIMLLLIGYTLWSSLRG
jgi:hypothetical protein